MAMKFSEKEEYLRQSDNKLRKIIDTNGPINFKPTKEHQFNSLVSIVISQFISTSAANSIFKNVKLSFYTEYLNEKHFEDLTITEIKKLGLSFNKARTIKELSELFLSKGFQDLTEFREENLRDKLLSVFGIGPWSVNMFEIFCIGKLDIFSSKDAGLRLAMNNHEMVSKNSNYLDYDIYANKWSPFRTIACLHLWKTVD